MTRSEAYAEGFHEGRRYAEADIGNALGTAYWMDRLTEDARGPHHPSERAACWRAEALGRARGYRDTVARYDAETLTPEMFELGPVNR